MTAAEPISPTYRAVAAMCSPMIRWWGRLEVSGLEHFPDHGPTLLASNHDSYWDPLAGVVATRRVRQVHALAKASLWEVRVIGRVLDGMGQIPIVRGAADTAALDRAVAELRAGACIGVFLEGTRSMGQPLRARSGFGRLAAAVPDARVICCAIEGTTDLPRFPRRPRVRVTFFAPAAGGLGDGESHAEMSERLLAEIRRRAPVVAPSRRLRSLRTTS